MNSATYKDYETSATQYFVSKEISQYKKSNDLNEEIIIEQQDSLEKENQNIKTEMKNIRNLEVQIRQIESKMSTNKIKMQQIENDISNLDTNQKIDDEIALNNKNNPPERRIVTGNVSTQAKTIFITVPFCKFFNPLFATMLPIIPELNMCVVLTGTPKRVATPMPIEAINSAEAPCA